MNNRIKALSAGILLLACRAGLGTTLFVDTNGVDTNPGTEAKPFRTLERARDEIRRIKTAGPLPVGGITVEVRGGVYELARPIEQTDRDSGTDNAPVVYRTRGGEVGWAKSVGHFPTKELITLNYKQPPWSIHYPGLLNLLEDEPLAAKGNAVARNICWDGKWGSTESKALPYVVFKDNLLDTDPQFRDAPTFELESNSLAFEVGFQRIPFDKIGLYQTEDRASWPVAHSAGSPPEF